MPKVNSSVKATFPAGTHFGAGLFPDEAVAIGATTQAFLLQVGFDAALCDGVFAGAVGCPSTVSSTTAVSVSVARCVLSVTGA